VLEPLLGKHTPSFKRTLVTQGIEGGCHRGAGGQCRLEEN
jgi:hypothetical protein